MKFNMVKISDLLEKKNHNLVKKVTEVVLCLKTDFEGPSHLPQDLDHGFISRYW